jgi:hypothetical protein
MRIKELLTGLSVAAIFLTGCENPPKAPALDLSSPPELTSAVSRNSIKNTIGMVTKAYYGNDFHHAQKLEIEWPRIFRFYNLDGSLWLELPEISESFKFVDFRPYAWDYDDGILLLKCVRQDETYVEVIVNEEFRIRKLIKKTDPVFSFESWENYLLNQAGLDFDKSLNPPRESPLEDSTPIKFPENTIFNPLKIQGDWMYGSFRKVMGTDVKGHGWIKWKINDEIVVQGGIDEC